MQDANDMVYMSRTRAALAIEQGTPRAVPSLMRLLRPAAGKRPIWWAWVSKALRHIGAVPRRCSYNGRRLWLRLLDDQRF